MNEQIDIVFDVDGVWNAFDGREEGTPDWGWPCEAQFARVPFANGASFVIRYSPDLITRVHGLVARPEVTPYWLTTWCQDAPQRLAGAIGLDGSTWPVLGEDDFNSRTLRWWKLPAIQRHLHSTDHRVVWIDDDLAFDSTAQAWVKGMNADETRILGIAPETHIGLTCDHLDLIERWIETGEVA